MTEPSTAHPQAHRGRFVTFEGGEGAGKSTQVSRLVAALTARGFEAIATREPGGSPNAEALRKVLLSGLVAPLGPAAEAMIFSAARIDHIENTIAPALARGAFVVCDRFIDSTRAYQGALGKISDDFIDTLEGLTVGALRPDLTIILDLPAETGLARATKRRGLEQADRFEAEDIGFHRGLRDAFQKIAQKEPRRCVLIDASRDEATIAADILQHVEKRLLEKGSAP